VTPARADDALTSACRQNHGVHRTCGYDGAPIDPPTSPMTESLTVKCPACSHEFALSEGILSSVRAGLASDRIWVPWRSNDPPSRKTGLPAPLPWTREATSFPSPPLRLLPGT
jgi:hypothetical protein